METVEMMIKETETVLFLNTAQQIGDHLVETAIWDDKKKYCNWLGRRDIIDKEIQSHSTRTAAMSPEFYSGSAGIALFLMELYGEIKNESYYNTALGAWFRSVSYLQKNDFPASPISFYAGDLGLLHVAYRFIEIERNIENLIKNEIEYLIKKIENGLSVNHSLDIIGGNAGAIGILFKLANNHGLTQFLKVAEDCANEIVALAKWKENICFWDSPKIHGVELDKPPLTGYSHGSSGLGLGLLKAFEYTRNEKYLVHARGAFEFEKALFNDDENNWVDTRYPHVMRNGKITGTFRSAWCHGAPGIALAHMGAIAIDVENKEFHEDMAKRAISSTHKYLVDKIAEPQKDATLCHGTFGLSDILYTYGKVVNSDEHVSISVQHSAELIRKFKSVKNIPSGINAGGYSPSLLTGIAGIGLHFLRLYSKNNIPSVLYIH